MDKHAFERLVAPRIIRRFILPFLPSSVLFFFFFRFFGLISFFLARTIRDGTMIRRN